MGSHPKAPTIDPSILAAAAAPPIAAPAPTPVTPIPDAGDIPTQVSARRAAASASNRSGRLSTILNSDTLGG